MSDLFSPNIFVPVGEISTVFTYTTPVETWFTCSFSGIVKRIFGQTDRHRDLLRAGLAVFSGRN